MLVRDKTKPVDDWDGRLCDAAHKDCPCHPCYHPHNFPERGDRGVGVYMMCLTRERGACNYSYFTKEPAHILTPRGKVCKRCGERVK